MNEEDLIVALVLGGTVKLSAIIHDAAASMGLETPLTLAALILAGVLVAYSFRERKKE